jgi:parvulin-like peptidyl-prolyl isomerase
MPLMTKIREKMATFFAVFAGAFVIYIVLDWGMDLTGQKQASRAREAQEVGSINGQTILYTEFSEMVRNAAENQKNQTGVEPNEEQLRALRDQIWNQLVEQKLYEDESKELGIRVTDQEIVDLVRGDNPPDFLTRQFTDSLGNFNRQAYEEALRSPQNRNVWVQVEDILRRQRLQEKLRSAIMASARVSDEEIKQKFMDQNIKYDAEYILFDPNILVKEDEVQATDEDCKKFFNEHTEEYKAEATRKLKYVLFEEVPSKGDTDAVMNEMNELLAKTKSGVDFVELATTYSEIPPSDAFFKHGEISPEKESVVFSAKPGDIIGPLKESDGYHLLKVLDFKTGKDEFIRASHILIKILGTDSAGALKKAKDIVSRIMKGESFSALAQSTSQDPGSAVNGGDLGWFGKGRMVKEFEEAAYKAKLNQVVGPVKSAFGYHIIKVTGRDSREVKFADIFLSIRMSSQSREAILAQAEDFAAQSKKEGNFEDIAKQLNYTVTETQPFQKGGVIPAIGNNVSVNKFAFTGKIGDISNVFSLSNAYGVFMISDAREAGVRPFDELKSAIELRVKREMKMKKVKGIAETVLSTLTPTDDLQKVATQYPNLSAQRLSQITFSGFVPGIGRDLGFIGGISALNPGDISKPIEGARGYYIIKLIGKSSLDSTLFNAQKENLRKQMLSERRNKIVSDWFENVKKNADIVDNRDIFYR